MRQPPILSEALRLFFPLAALHGAVWPFLWVAAATPCLSPMPFRPRSGMPMK